jgi:N-acetylmuramoyl-L-alanine amidase
LQARRLRARTLKKFDRSQRAKRLGTALFLLLLPVLPVQARGKSEAWAHAQFSAAERTRETLNSLPAAQRNRHEYRRVITAYRRVYYGAPTSTRADASVVAVAELLAEMGRGFNDSNTLRSAIGQYKFLRREYPGSRYRFDSLFTIGQIYQDDLNDPVQAKPVFEEFLRRYPRNRLVDAARKALAEPVQQASLKSKDDLPDPVASTGARSKDGTRKLARVTNIRHWSSPDYSRVAIDLEQDVKFESQRIDHPERIFFDLLDVNLDATLLGKTFEVDDGLLKKIRVAQFQPGKARIVLEVAARSDYEAFLLTHPSRLIVDIQGQDVQSKDSQAKAVRGKPATQAASLEESEAASPENSNTADRAVAAQTEAPAAVDTKSAVKGTSRRPASLTGVASSTGAKKTVVEADSEDGDGGVRVANLDPPDIKPLAKAATVPVPSTLSKSSARSKHKTAPSFPDAREASPTATGDRSLIRALGLKIGKIVIDPGHGGHDTGTIGPKGLEEKDLVLDVGRRLGKLLRARLGADVVYTRKDDTFIPLETRTSIANQEQADLFVSIHANSSRDRDARGVETYYLNFTSSAEALDVAARENAASDKSLHELQDLVKKIALKEKIEESREFASNVQRALHSGLAAKSPGIRDRGVKKAPFIVLIGANMPSILAEISFVSNPGDERRLGGGEYRQRIAESLYQGIAKYVSGLSGVKFASKIDKDGAR